VRRQPSQAGGGQRAADHQQQAGDQQPPVGARPLPAQEQNCRQQGQPDQRQGELPPAALGLGQPVAGREDQRRVAQQQVADVPHAADRRAEDPGDGDQPEVSPQPRPIQASAGGVEQPQQPEAPHQRPGGGLGPHPAGQHQAGGGCVAPGLPAFRPPGQQHEQRRQREIERQRNFQIAKARPVDMRGKKRPQRGGQQPGAAIGQPCAQQIGRADAAQGHERDGRAGGVIVDPAPDHLPEGIEQRQQLRVIVHAGGNLAGQGEDAGVVAVDPQGVIGGEGPVGDADHAQDQGDDQAGHDQAGSDCGHQHHHDQTPCWASDR